MANGRAARMHELELDKEDLLESAWGLIANAFGGDWQLAPEEWRKAAERWRDGYHEVIKGQ